jgi:rod shape-determining protein MreC
MHWLFQLIVRHRDITSLLLTVSVSLWMIAGSVEQRERISRTLVMTVFFPFQFTVHQVSRIKNIFAENQRLHVQVTALSARLSELAEVSSENTRLRELMGFESDFGYEIVPARVVAREPSHFSRGIVINAGRDQQIERYMPVVDARGAVGKVVQVLSHMSFVQLLNDPVNRTGVMFQRSRVVGILEVSDRGAFLVRVRSHADVVPGDTIATSGLGGVYPKGLRVGVVGEIRDEQDPLFKVAEVVPSVDYGRLEEVFVMRMSPQWSAFVRELDSLEVGE